MKVNIELEEKDFSTFIEYRKDKKILDKTRKDFNLELKQIKEEVLINIIKAHIQESKVDFARWILAQIDVEKVEE